MDHAEVLRRSGLNLASYVAHNARSAPGGAVDERDGLVCFAGGHPYPGTHTNGIIRTTTDLAPAEALARARAFFAPRRFSFTVWIRDEVDADLEAECVAAGFELRPPDAGMPAISIEGPIDTTEHVLDPAAELVRVETRQQADDYVSVVGRGFEMNVPVAVASKIFFDPTALFDDRVHAFVAYLDGEPVSVCMAFVEHGYAGLYSGASLPAARGRGLARACLATATNAGMAAGARFAGGQSADMGLPIWTRMGFETLAHWRRYIGRP